MKALRKLSAGFGNVELCDVEAPSIKDDEIIVDSNSSGILVAKYYGKYYRVKLQCLEQGTVRVNFIYQAYR